MKDRVTEMKMTGSANLRGEHAHKVLWEGRYQDRRCWFVTVPDAQPVSSPEAWWKSASAAKDAEVATTRELRMMNRRRVA